MPFNSQCFCATHGFVTDACWDGRRARVELWKFLVLIPRVLKQELPGFNGVHGEQWNNRSDAGG